MGALDSQMASAVGKGVLVLSAVMIFLCSFYMQKYSDSRLVLTTLDVFHDWAGLRRVFDNATQYLPIANPPTLGLIRFDPWGTDLGQYEDMLNRGLITQEQFKNVSLVFAVLNPGLLSATHPSLLYRLLSTAGCTVPNARPHTSPATRSPGCQCIADTYLGFVNETAQSSANVSSEVRSKYAGRVLGCLDRLVTRKTATCRGRCSVHPVGLALYSNSALFLSCMAFLLFSGGDAGFVRAVTGNRVWALQLIVCLVGALLSLPFFLVDVEGNLMNILGLMLVVLDLVHGAREDLEDLLQDEAYAPLRSGRVHPHPLTVCVCVNLHLIIPAYTIAVGVSGFARDFFAVSCFGVSGLMIGVVLQFVLWDSWYSPEEMQSVKLPCFGLIGGVFGVSFVWLYSAYFDPDGVFYVSGALGMTMFTLVIVGIVISFVAMYGQRADNKSAHHVFGRGEQTLCVLLLLGNLLLTVLTILDASLL